jgi:hypothetical protein
MGEAEPHPIPPPPRPPFQFRLRTLLLLCVLLGSALAVFGKEGIVVFRPSRRRCHRPSRLWLAKANGNENCEANGLRPTPRSSYPVFPLAGVHSARGTKGSMIERGEGPRF